MESEKAAIQRSLAHEARFREEKHQIVARLGGSPAELLTPSSDSRLRRKLANGSSRDSSSLLAENSASSFQENALSAIPEQAASGAGLVAAVVDDDHPVLLSNRMEREQYQDEELREQSRKCNKKTSLYTVGAILALTLGSLVGVMLALMLRPHPPAPSVEEDDGGADSVATGNRCKLDRVALAQCANKTLNVPDCAKVAYEKLANTFVLGEEVCDDAHKGLVATAVSKTNHGDELVDPTMYFAISTLFFALGGDQWRIDRGWLEGKSPCSGSWYGVYCSPSGSLKLQLDGNRLQGTIPTEIALLSNLETISISSNLVTGALPSEIGLLSRLNTLTAKLTQISSLPSEIGNLTELVELTLSDSPLSGTIPTEIGKLINLQSLAFVSNHFTGTIPTELEGLVNIQDMVLYNMQGISGSLPSKMFARLSNLRFLWMGLPGLDEAPALEDISMASSLTNLQVENMDLSGSLAALTALSHLEEFSFLSNHLTGTIFTEIGLLTNLVDMQVHRSDLVGTMPSEVGLLTKLRRLDVGEADFLTGTLPSEIGLLTNLRALDVFGTRLSGTVPAEVCALNMLRGHNYFYFQDCDSFERCLIDNCS